MIESEVSAPSILWLSHSATSFPFSAFAIVPGVPVSTSVDTGSGGPWGSDTRIQYLLPPFPYWAVSGSDKGCSSHQMLHVACAALRV